ncbi:hypothetical protein WJX74_001145 [Apatococcus lobatus]|uniref:Uncharacterized protein n=1 Tax=Apatococcus lobatus TaxID=904363 RepID=A0AAW1QAJ9_9CHLO
MEQDRKNIWNYLRDKNDTKQRLAALVTYEQLVYEGINKRGHSLRNQRRRKCRAQIKQGAKIGCKMVPRRLELTYRNGYA